MRQRDQEALLLGGLALLIASALGRRRSSDGSYVDVVDEEIRQVPSKPATPGKPYDTSDPPRAGGGGATGTWEDEQPATAPISDEPPKPGMERVNVLTLQRVLIKLGYKFQGELGRYNEETSIAYRQAVVTLNDSFDDSIDKAGDVKAWVMPDTAGMLAAAANAGKKPFDYSASATPTAASSAAAEQVSRDALEAAKRAAQIAAQTQPKDLGVAKPVPQIPLPNPAPTSPPTPINLERARRSAPLVDKEVKSRRDKYDRKMVAQFQADAGLVPDGLYGPVTQSALKYFGVRDPAKPVFKNKNYTAYQPPA